MNASTIEKYFSGINDDSANFEIVRRLVATMGGSLDELAGIGTGAERDLGAYQMVVAGLEARLGEKDERISARWRLAEKERERAEEEIAYERRRARATSRSAPSASSAGKGMIFAPISSPPYSSGGFSSGFFVCRASRFSLMAASISTRSAV